MAWLNTLITPLNFDLITRTCWQCHVRMSVLGLSICLSRQRGGGLAINRGLRRLIPTSSCSIATRQTSLLLGNHKHGVNINPNLHIPHRLLSSSAVSQVRKRQQDLQHSSQQYHHISRTNSSSSSTLSSSVLESRLQSEQDVLDETSLTEQERADKGRKRRAYSTLIKHNQL